jgi:hypothetical protein
MLIKSLRLLLGAGGAVLLARAIFGPFRLGVPVNSPLTAATVCGFAFVATMLLRGGVERPAKAGAPRWLIVAVLAVVVLSFVRATPYSFISDDYSMLHQAREFTPARVPYILTHSSDATFFRPIGDLAWYLEYPLAGVRPAAWHGIELAVHTLNCALVYLLFSGIFASRIVGLWSTLFFGLHPANIEAVCYVGGGQEILLASLFLLCSLVLFVRHARRPSSWVLSASLAAGFLALWSKESAYVLPVLATLAAWRVGVPVRRTIPLWILTAAAFAYRAILIGGLGGYRETHLTLPGAAKAVALRLWAILAIPLNWSTPIEIYASIGLAAGIAGYLMLTRSAPARKDVCFAVAWIVACALPGIQMLLIGSDLLNSRLLYLSTVGFAVLLASCAQTRLLAGVLMGVFFVTALEHNLTIWSDVTEQARQTCIAAATGHATSRPEGERNGVWFFANGFPECVQMEK